MDFLHYALMGTTAAAAIAAYTFATRGVAITTEANARINDANKLSKTYLNQLNELNGQYDSKINECRQAKADIGELNRRIAAFQDSINQMGQAETDTNGKLLRLGQHIVNLKAAIKKARESGKLAPNARRDINAAIDNQLQYVIDTAPKKVEITRVVSPVKEPEIRNV